MIVLAQRSHARYENVCAAHWQLVPLKFNPKFRGLVGQQSTPPSIARRKAEAASLRRSDLKLETQDEIESFRETRSTFLSMRRPRPSPAKRYYHEPKQVVGPIVYALRPTFHKQLKTRKPQEFCVFQRAKTIFVKSFTMQNWKWIW